MKPYLLIRNAGLAPIESFTILGLSTARGEADKIGQFGSGSKHGLLALIRAGVQPIIFIGLDRLEFFTRSAQMGEKDYQEILYSYQGETHKTGMCLEFGALDWTSPTMALREFICNALDQGEVIHQCTGESDSADAVDGETRVYIPSEKHEIQEYWNNLRGYFLHYDGNEKTAILPARTANAQFFRRGVYVTERTGFKSPSLFLYNFQEGRIDESRNMDGAAMGKVAALLLRKSQPHLEIIFQSFQESEKWEHTIGSAMWDYSESGKKEIGAAWKKIHGEKPFCKNPQIQAQLIKKGVRHVVIPGSWANALAFAGITDGEILLSGLEEKNADECEPTESAVETFKRAWKWLEIARLTKGKPFPSVKCFSKPMEDGKELRGYFQDNTVYINLDEDTNEQTALEELAHYITGAQDETRDFQDFAFRLATRLAKARSLGQTPEAQNPVSTTSEPQIRTAYFTFGQGHEHSLAGKTYGRNDVVKIETSDPRARMVELFGLKWAFEYETLPKMEFYSNGITDLSGDEPQSVTLATPSDDPLEF